jgi:hypothetical protein
MAQAAAVPGPGGLELRFWISASSSMALASRSKNGSSGRPANSLAICRHDSASLSNAIWAIDYTPDVQG